MLEAKNEKNLEIKNITKVTWWENGYEVETIIKTLHSCVQFVVIDYFKYRLEATGTWFYRRIIRIRWAENVGIDEVLETIYPPPPKKRTPLILTSGRGKISKT